MVKIIFSDLDGTLLSGGQTAISDRNMRAMSRAAQNGVYVVPCTGRCVDMLPPQLLTAEFVRYVVSCHGARVYDRLTGETLYDGCFTPEESYEILKVIEKRNIYIETYANTRVYVERHLADHLPEYPTPKHHTWYMYDRRYIAVENIAEYFRDNGLKLEKVNIYGMPKEIQQEVYDKLKALGSIRFTFEGAQPDLELCPKNLSKKAAAEVLLARLGIDPEEAFAIGDSHADCEILGLVGVSVAMGNAMPVLKEMAKYITDKNTEDGVGKAIEKYVLGETEKAELPSLDGYVKVHDRLVCIDSDGCAMDTMEIKHKECFCTALIECFGLQPVAKYAREAWNFVNLYSKTRGIYRMKTLIMTMELLEKRREVGERGFKVPDMTPLKEWCESHDVLNDVTLAAYAKTHGDEILRTTLEWSAECNRRIARLVHGVPPFPYVKEALAKLSENSDIVVVSATPTAALEKEWKEHDVKKYTAFICGQEYGGKKDIICAVGKEYSEVLMIGDAIGDLRAAEGAGAKFYPIIPNAEDKSWKEFYATVADIFVSGDYDAEVQKKYVAMLDEVLPDTPEWEK